MPRTPRKSLIHSIRKSVEILTRPSPTQRTVKITQGDKSESLHVDADRAIFVACDLAGWGAYLTGAVISQSRCPTTHSNQQRHGISR